MAQLNKSFRNILIGIGFLAVIICVVICIRAWKENQLGEEVTKRVIAQEALKVLAKQHVENKRVIDSMKIDRAQLVSVIEYQKKNPQIIIQKYETIHRSIDNLSPNDNYKLFTANIAKYKSNRKRYSLQRFK